MTVVEVFADVTCPFTHVGLRRFVELRHEIGRDDVQLVVRAWPLEIVNGHPLDAHFIAEEVDDIRRQVAPDLFEGFRESAFPATSLPALALAAAAYDRDTTTGEQVSLQLRDLLFEQGVDIANLGVLEPIATAHGLRYDPTDTRQVVAEHEQGIERGVIGSPHFFTPAGGFFCPALDINRGADGHLRITADATAFDQFVSTCFD